MNLLKKRPLRFALQLAAVAVLILLDHIIKAAVYDKLRGRETLVLIKGFLGFTYAENTGAAFSMLSSSTALLSAVTGAALIAATVIMFFLKEKPVIYHICLPLIIAGGAGNLLDRLTRGYVIDYIHALFIDFPVFNFADCLITCACFSLIIYLVYDIIADRKKEKAQSSVSETEEKGNG